MRTILLLLSAALCGCASKPSPSPQAVDTRALCQQLAQASASSRELRSSLLESGNLKEFCAIL
jgi:hypothetical protein